MGKDKISHLKREEPTALPMRTPFVVPLPMARAGAVSRPKKQGENVGELVSSAKAGHAAMRLVRVHTVPSIKDRGVLLNVLRKSGATKVSASTTAARSQDFSL